MWPHDDTNRPTSYTLWRVGDNRILGSGLRNWFLCSTQKFCAPLPGRTMVMGRYIELKFSRCLWANINTDRLVNASALLFCSGSPSLIHNVTCECHLPTHHHRPSVCGLGGALEFIAGIIFNSTDDDNFSRGKRTKDMILNPFPSQSVSQ